jgi:small subunit ribosomal protein S3
MGQKVNPTGLRLGITTNWDSRWYADGKNYAEKLHQDLEIKKFIKSKLAHAAVSKVVIERLNKKTKIAIHTAKPGVVIGKKGDDMAKIKDFVSKITGDEVSVNIVEIRRAEVEAQIVANTIAQQIESHTPFKKAMRGAMRNAMKMGAQGIKVMVSGRLGGAEIARSEWDKEGRIPLHTLRANVDYAIARANTTYGVIGIKVWIFKGEIFKKRG